MSGVTHLDKDTHRLYPHVGNAHVFARATQNIETQTHTRILQALVGRALATPTRVLLVQDGRNPAFADSPIVGFSDVIRGYVAGILRATYQTIPVALATEMLGGLTGTFRSRSLCVASTRLCIASAHARGTMHGQA